MEQYGARLNRARPLTLLFRPPMTEHDDWGLPEAQGKTPPELLAAVKPAIQGAYTVRPL